MAEMTMIEEGATIKWECSECRALVKDRNGFESKVERCPQENKRARPSDEV